jgi:hypothetical protein
VNVNRYERGEHGRIVVTTHRARQAEVAFATYKYSVRSPYSLYYRVTLTDPSAGNRILKDTDTED